MLCRLADNRTDVDGYGHKLRNNLAFKGGREIAVIGHTDCQVCKTTVMKLTEGFRALGVDRSKLPDNLNEYFGLFASERQNVIRGAELVRQSPIIGSKVPVHGLVMDIQTGRLEWLVNGYQTVGGAAPSFAAALKQTATETVGQIAAEALGLAAAKLPEFKIGEMKFPELKIGETTITPNQWLAEVQAITSAGAGLHRKCLMPKALRHWLRRHGGHRRSDEVWCGRLLKKPLF